MKKWTGVLAISFALTLILSSFSLKEETAAEPATTKLEWHTSLQKAHDLSAKTGKPIFGFFTGSDWCGWCMKLQREVFAKPEFIAWAQENVILLELDFPKRTPQSDELKAQNRSLQQAFKVTGYPTIWLFKSKKNATTGNFELAGMGSLGYPSGAERGKEQVKFLTTANAILATKK
jgi:thiol-disulfide isomerase/thioredoxin